MISNAERLEILKSIPKDLSEADREAMFLTALRDRLLLEEKQKSTHAQPALSVTDRKPCGSCGGGKVL